MNRIATLLCACCIVLAVGHEQTHAAPTATKAKKTVAKTSKRTRGARPTAEGPGVSMRRGVARIGVAPKDTQFGAGFDWFFDALDVKSANAGPTLGKVEDPGPVVIPKVSLLTASKPDNGAMFLSAYNAHWRARSIGFLPAEIHIEYPDGGLAIHVPLDASLEGEDLRVECRGSFNSPMTVRAAVIPNMPSWGGLGGMDNDGSELTHTAQFMGVTNELKFLLEVPTTSITSPMLNILIQAASTKNWQVQQCSIDRI